MIKPLRRSLLFFMLLLNAAIVFSTTYFVAVNGSDDQPGTIELPLASMQKVQELVQPGVGDQGIPESCLSGNCKY